MSTNGNKHPYSADNGHPPKSGGRSRRDPLDWANLLAIAGDTAMALLGLLIGFWVRFRSDWIPKQATWWSKELIRPVQLAEYANLIFVGVLFLILTLMYLRLYETHLLLRFRQAAHTIVRGATFWLLAYVGISRALTFKPPISRIYVLVSFATCIATLLVWRSFFHWLIRRESIAQRLRQNLIFVGWNREAERLANAIVQDPSQPYRIAGYVGTHQSTESPSPPPDIKRLGDYSELFSVVRVGSVDTVVLADLEAHSDDIVAIANFCEQQHVQFKVIPSYFQILVSGLHLETIHGVPIMGLGALPLDRWHNRSLKRLVDLVGALVGILLGTPIVAVLAAMIWIESRGSVFFTQERVGRRGKTFKMLKLRSMKLGSETEDNRNQSTLRDDSRILRIGRWMRKWNLDEVPQFWNVLMGDMSLVGPRPERTFHSEKLSSEIPHYNARYVAKPGMTGWAQVNGLRGNTDLVERVRYDLHYLENWSLWLDAQIMVQTFIRRDNAY